MPMINQTPESRFAGLLKPFFDSIDPSETFELHPNLFAGRALLHIDGGKGIPIHTRRGAGHATSIDSICSVLLLRSLEAR